MSNVNYDLKKRGVRMISSEEAWVKTKSGGVKLNPMYRFVGKVDMQFPNMILSASDKKKFAYIDDVCKLPAASKRQLVRQFYDDEGQRTGRRVAYLVETKKCKGAKEVMTKKMIPINASMFYNMFYISFFF